MRVFIVDDDPSARILLDVWLTHAGHSVVVFVSGGAVVEALNLPDAALPAIVVTDLVMDPGVSGVDVAKNARSLSVPVMIYTGQDIGLIPARWRPWALAKDGNRTSFLEKLDAFANPAG